MERTIRNDFATGSVWRHILKLAVPMTIAQLVQVLYNIVDRIYIGHLPGTSSLALTGLGLTFPVITLIIAFTNLFGMGGAPLFSIARGKGEEDRAEKIMGNTLAMLCLMSIVLMFGIGGFIKPILYLFGASDTTYPFAGEYIRTYLVGTPFVMLSAGMNQFIHAQGFGKTGMYTVLIGAIANLVLDPIFIYLFQMGIAGAAVATVISQFLSAAWVLCFLLGKKAIVRIKKSSLLLSGKLLKEMVSLGMAGFIMASTSGLVQVACNATLKGQGGDIYVGVMTVLNSVREIVMLPIQGITSASQPVLGYNFGAGKGRRIIEGIRFTTAICIGYTAAAWLLVFLLPEFLIGIFNTNQELIRAGIPAMRIYFFGFFMMALQFAGQSAFVGLGQSRQAVFFSLFRKVIIVLPLTLLLPKVAALGVNGVFLAEPISNFLGGTACFVTMNFTVKKIVKPII